MVTIVLADDHVIVRQGLRALLESDRNFVVVGEAADGLQAVELVKHRSPNVLISDLMMPGLDGLETLRKLSRLELRPRVILLSMYGDVAYVLTALRSGAAGYVVKESCGAELLQAVRDVVSGQCYVSPSITESARGSLPLKGTVLERVQRTHSDSRKGLGKLTVRERQVLQLLVEGANTLNISSRLKIHLRTVKAHQANCMRKLGLSTSQDLIRYVLRSGRCARESGQAWAPQCEVPARPWLPARFMYGARGTP